MFGIARKGADSAGGAQMNGGQDFVRVDGDLVVLLGDPVTPHGTGQHGAPVMAEGSSFLRVAGVPVCRAGHLADCGHATSGSDFARASD